MFCGSPVWACTHPGGGTRQIDDVMKRPPEWCPLDKESALAKAAPEMYRALLLAEANMKRKRGLDRTLAVVRAAIAEAEKEGEE